MADTPNTDYPDTVNNYATNSPNANDNDSLSKDSKKTNIYWENTINFSKTHTTPKTTFKNVTDATDGDAKISEDSDDADAPSTDENDAGSKDSRKFQYLLRNWNNSPHDTDGDADSTDEAASLDSLIDSKIICKIDPKSMIKIYKLKRQLPILTPQTTMSIMMQWTPPLTHPMMPLTHTQKKIVCETPSRWSGIFCRKRLYY